MKTHKNQNRVLGTVILLTLLLSLIFPSTTVFADDTTPPGETTEVVDAPAEEETLPEDEFASEGETPAEEEPAVEEPAADELAVEEMATEEPAAEEVATEEPAAEKVATEEAVTEEPAPEEEAQADAEPVLAQLPEGTDVVVLDEAGEVVPLATQEAVEAIATSDPMWCPENEEPGDPGCTIGYPSMTALLAALAGASQPTANGTIWIEKTYDSSVADPAATGFTFDGNNGNFSTWRDYSLTIQGGWNGPGTTTIDHNTPSVFSGDYLRIVNWRNNVTINDILINGATADDNLEITTTGNVTLENVESSNNPTRRGALIDNDAGTGTVTVNNSKFIDNGDGGDDGLYISSQGNVTLLNVIATGNKGDGVEINNTPGSLEATVQILSTGLGKNVFTGNTGTGLRIYSEGNVSLNNITADTNGYGTYIENQNSTTNAVVTLTGANSFSNNTSNGLYVRSKGAITLSNVTANGSTNDSGAILDNDETGAVGGVTINGTNSFSGNNDNGLSIDSRGAVSLNNITADGNKTATGVYIENCNYSGGACQGSGDVTLTGTLNFTNNGNGGDDGLYISSSGNVTMADVVATGNKGDGVQVTNYYSTTSAAVAINGTNVFTGNNGTGLLIDSKGNVSLNNVTANTNTANGVNIENYTSTSNAIVTITGANSFSGNTSDGLYVRSKGAISLSSVTANGNTNGNGAYLMNDYADAIGGVAIDGSNSFNTNYNSGLVIDTRGAVSLANITADGNIRGDGVNIDNCSWGGSTLGCLGSGDVTLTGTLAFTNNGNSGDRGLYVYSNGNVTMADVTATGNIGNGVEINNASNATSTTSATVTIGGTNVFTGNVGYGLLINSKGNVGLNNLTADTNNYGTYIYNNTSTTNAIVTVTGANSFSGNTYEGLYIYSMGAINLSNITANGNTNGNTSGTGAYLRNDYTGAVGGVTISGTNSFSGNDASGLVVDSRGAVSLNNIIAGSNIYGNGVNIENCNYSSGVCQGSGDVTLTGTLVFTNNGDNDDGLVISTSGNVSMANVTATGNGDEGVQVSNTNSTTNAFVQISGTNVFSGNTGYGLYVNSKGAITASNVTANGSTAYGGAYLDNDETGAVGGVTLTGSNSFSGNDDYGLQIYSLGAVGLNNITANNNVTQFGANIYNAGTNASGDVTITGTNSFSGNDDYGLQISSKGGVSLENITADGNLTQDGLNIDNCNWGGSSVGCQGSGDVTITGANSFSNNGNGGSDFGLNINSGSAVTLENVTANSNKDSGVYIDNTRSSTDATVTMNGVNTISNNLNDGLVIYSDGTIKVNEITADSNGAGRDDAGVRLDNDTGTGDVIVTGYYNSFSNNTGPGLYISTRGNIELFFATITGNNTWSGSQNGAVFTSPGATSNSARVYCSVFGNNNGYGLDAWNFEDSLTFVGQNNFSGNPSGDYRFNGTASFVDPDYLCEEPVLGCTEPDSINFDPSANTNDGSCIPIVRGCMDPTAFNYDPSANTDNNSCIPVVKGCMDPADPTYNPEANTPIKCTEETPKPLTSFLIPVTGGQLVPISCEAPTTKLQMANGDFVSFVNLCGYEALLDKVLEAGLPEGLPGDSQYVSGLSVALMQDGSKVEPLPDGTSMTVAFRIPSGMEGESFNILHWDGSQWVEESVTVGNGYVKVTSSNTGAFVLVAK